MTAGELPEPRKREGLAGHLAAARMLAADFAAGRLHHAWIFAGPRGIGKATLAFRFARYTLAGQAGFLLEEPASAPLHLPADDPVFRRVSSGGHADLRVVEPAGARGEIRVDAIRDAFRFLRLTPGEAAWRVLIVDGADSMNVNAQNAALKLLEEPPPNVLILLVAHRPSLLLATVRSRCRLLRLTPLDRPEFDEVLRDIAPELDDEACARLFAVAGGSPGTALELEQLGGRALKEAVDALLDLLPAIDRQALDTVAAAVTVSREAAHFQAFGRILSASLAERLRTARTDAALLEAEAGVSRLLERSTALSLDRRQVVFEIFGGLARTVAGRGEGVSA
ncbi:MAG: DNA polymerase III subunit delta' [Alphaproteobacteria bacterium]|nr:DNA polymerase III subunit delta' [Alphaproteobacteria bacterium]